MLPCISYTSMTARYVYCSPHYSTCNCNSLYTFCMTYLPMSLVQTSCTSIVFCRWRSACNTNSQIEVLTRASLSLSVIDQQLEHNTAICCRFVFFCFFFWGGGGRREKVILPCLAMFLVCVFVILHSHV